MSYKVTKFFREHNTTNAMHFCWIRHKKEEYEKLVRDIFKNIIYTDCNAVQDSKTIPGTQSLFQVQGQKHYFTTNNGCYSLDLFDLKCSCANYLQDLHNISSCFF